MSPSSPPDHALHAARRFDNAYTPLSGARHLCRAARGNLLVAEATLRAEIPRPTLVDLRELTALIATEGDAPSRRSRGTLAATVARRVRRRDDRRRRPRDCGATGARQPAPSAGALDASSHGRRIDWSRTLARRTLNGGPGTLTKRHSNRRPARYRAGVCTSQIRTIRLVACPLES
jgi:hypothetical protein